MVRAKWQRSLLFGVCGFLFGLNVHQGQAFGQTTAYGYDALGRLTSASRTDGTSSSYAYDPAGNRTHVAMTAPSATPAAFDLGGPVSANPGVWVASNAPIISGIGVPVPVAIIGGYYRINGGAWQSAAGTISAGQTVQVQVQAPASGASQTATLTVGGVSDTFQVAGVANVLLPGEVLFRGQALMSNDTQSRLELRWDGSLVITCNGVDQYPIWGASDAVQLNMQVQGNLVLYSSVPTALWYTGVGGYPGAYLVLQDDGNLVIYDGSTPIWYTWTFC